MLIEIRFVDHEGNPVTNNSIYILYGECLLNSQIPSIAPADYRTISHDYTFEKWGITKNQVFDEDTDIKAIYIGTKREYDITYTLDDGTVILSNKQKYGDKLDTSVQAPTKGGTFLYDYEFVGWGFENDNVTGNMVGVAKYRMVIGTNFVLIILTILLILIISSSTINFIKRKKKIKN